ncbi:MAG: thioredoxin-dependent thiol peroxidase [Thaumarchaeota archaeon]|nr:thioredoxin-dependent thiol peroxidase [Nitrososphaerota archaeon]
MEVEKGELNEGDPAPDFELPGTGGKQVRLSSFRGKRVVLYFYPEDDTPGCVKEACAFRDSLRRFEGADAVILGISRDSLESHKKFIEKYSLNFTLLSDEGLEVHKMYGTWKLKNNYGRTYWGTERSTFLIDERGKLKRIFRRVKVDGHDKDVLDALNA